MSRRFADSAVYSRQLERCPEESPEVLPRVGSRCMIPLQDYLPLEHRPNRPQAPEIQQMYSLNMPVSAIRTKMRQEFERHRYVQQLKTVDVLLFNSHQEYQVRRHLLVHKIHILTLCLPRKPSTSGSSSLMSSSTSAPRKTPRLLFPRTSSKVSSRYEMHRTNIICQSLVLTLPSGTQLDNKTIMRLLISPAFL